MRRISLCVLAVIFWGAATTTRAECPNRACRRPAPPKHTGGAVGLHPIQFWAGQWAKLEKRSAENPQAASLFAAVIAFGGVLAGVKATQCVRQFRAALSDPKPPSDETMSLPPG